MNLKEDLKKCKSIRRGPQKAYQGLGFINNKGKEVVEITEVDLKSNKKKIIYQDKEMIKQKKYYGIK